MCVFNLFYVDRGVRRRRHLLFVVIVVFRGNGRPRRRIGVIAVRIPTTTTTTRRHLGKELFCRPCSTCRRPCCPTPRHRRPGYSRNSPASIRIAPSKCLPPPGDSAKRCPGKWRILIYVPPVSSGVDRTGVQSSSIRLGCTP